MSMWRCVMCLLIHGRWQQEEGESGEVCYASSNSRSAGCTHVCLKKKRKRECQQRCWCTMDQIDSLEWLQMKQYITFNKQQYVYSHYSTPFSDSQTWRVMFYQFLKHFPWVTNNSRSRDFGGKWEIDSFLLNQLGRRHTQSFSNDSPCIHVKLTAPPHSYAHKQPCAYHECICINLLTARRSFKPSSRRVMKSQSLFTGSTTPSPLSRKQLGTDLPSHVGAEPGRHRRSQLTAHNPLHTSHFSVTCCDISTPFLSVCLADLDSMQSRSLFTTVWIQAESMVTRLLLK